MSRPTRRTGSTILAFRKRIPADLRGKVTGQSVLIHFPAHGSEPACTVAVTLGAAEVSFSLRTRDPHVAKARTGIAETHFQRLFNSLREGPSRLTHKQVVAVSGDWYRGFVANLEDDPGEALVLKQLQEACATPDLGEPDDCLSVFWQMADAALASRALVVDADSRRRLALAIKRAIAEAMGTLKRRAEGDYGPDVVVQRFPSEAVLPVPNGDRRTHDASKAPSDPTGRGSERGAAQPVSLTGLVEDWWKEAKALGRKPSTHESYTNTMAAFIAFLKQEGRGEAVDAAGKVTPEDVIGFKDHRLAQVNPRTGKPISPKTVKDSDLAGLRAVFDWAVTNRRVTSNPAAGITLKLGKTQRKRAVKGFTDAEAEAILRHVSGQRQGQERPQTFAAKRWVHWICAYTGARVGEIAQLRKEDIRQEGETWVVTISPEAGTVKTDEAREVPLHPHLVEMGFPAFVQSCKPGHLFLVPNRKTGDVLGPLQGVKNRLAELSREVVPDPNVQPTHGWRHRFKTLARDVEMDPGVRDAIQGHSAETVAESYGDVSLKAKVAAIAKLPRYQVGGEE
ncbi:MULTISPECIES: DUF6538 domain-containing protein [unclassified Xanthobacter]|uniref:DUF6538 domain-containing protein n=1 Tax=unclassified Xanthobacter TaxID=2623496 RepID=UPI001F2D635D|nr:MULTISPECIES: DUF6538 domain-containing protein [unclassified Xanthobacter]